MNIKLSLLCLLAFATLMSIYTSYTLFNVEHAEKVITQQQVKLVQHQAYVDKYEIKTTTLAKSLYVLRNVAMELDLASDVSSERMFDTYYRYVAPVDFELSEFKRKYFKEEYTKYSLNDFIKDAKKGSVTERTEAYHEIFLRFIEYKEELFIEAERVQESVSQTENAIIGLKKKSYLSLLAIGYIIFLLNIIILIKTQFGIQKKS